MRHRWLLAVGGLVVVEGLLACFALGAVFGLGPLSGLARLSEKDCRIEVVTSAHTDVSGSSHTQRRCTKQLDVALLFLLVLIPVPVQIGKLVLQQKENCSGIGAGAPD